MVHVSILQSKCETLVNPQIKYGNSGVPAVKLQNSLSVSRSMFHDFRTILLVYGRQANDIAQTVLENVERFCCE